jgi:hypothetical protein
LLIGNAVKVRIVQQPTGTLDGLRLDKYLLGNTYDVPASIAAYLVAEGFAQAEMRSERPPSAPPVSAERRRTPKAFT